MKKLIALFLASCMAFALAACSNAPAPNASDQSPGPSGTSEPAAEPVELTFATSLYVEEPHQKALDALLEAYNEKNPNVKITIYGAEYANFWNNLTTEIVSGQEADLIQIGPDTLNTYYALRDGGAFVPLDDYMAASGVDYGELLTGQGDCVIDGKNVGLSNYAWGTTGIFYRKSILEEAGVDPDKIVTSDDFVEALKATTKGDVVGMGAVVGTHKFVYSEWCRMFSHAIGGLFFEEEQGPYDAGHLVANSEANVWAAKWWQDLLLRDKVLKPGPDKKDARELFWNGLAAFNLDGPWFIGMTESRDPALLEDVGLIPHPQMVYKGQTYKARPTYSPYITCISSRCENVDAAWDFVEWMATAEAQEIIATCGMTPCNKEFSNTDEYRAKYPLAAKFGTFLENDYGELMEFPTTPKFGALEQVMVDATQEMFSEKGADPQTALDEAVAKMEEILNK